MEMNGLTEGDWTPEAWAARHRPRMTCPCETCLVTKGPVAERRTLAGYTLREIGAD